jgi:ABC-type glycerol-3-phosphate transport system substrate-binding protein
MKKILVQILILALLTGCVTSQHLVTGTARPAVSPALVELRPSVPTNAVEIGIVSAVSAGQNDQAMQAAVNALKKQAGGIGANVLVVVGSDLMQSASAGAMGYNFGKLIYTPNTTTRETKVQARAYYVEK